MYEKSVLAGKPELVISCTPAHFQIITNPYKTFNFAICRLIPLVITQTLPTIASAYSSSLSLTQLLALMGYGHVTY